MNGGNPVFALSGFAGDITWSNWAWGGTITGATAKAGWYGYPSAEVIAGQATMLEGYEGGGYLFDLTGAYIDIRGQNVYLVAGKYQEYAGYAGEIENLTGAKAFVFWYEGKPYLFVVGGKHESDSLDDSESLIGADGYIGWHEGEPVVDVLAGEYHYPENPANCYVQADSRDDGILTLKCDRLNG